MDRQTILCYGDSNTWGCNPDSPDPDNSNRYAFDDRWPGVLSNELFHNNFRIIEEGLNGRTTTWDDPLEPNRAGKVYLGPCLESHNPLDLVVLMLGTNDMKVRSGYTARDIAYGIEYLVNMVKNSCCGPRNGAPRILVLSPPPIGTIKRTENTSWERAATLAPLLPALYQEVAARHGCSFLNTHEVMQGDELVSDGIHLPVHCHHKLGKAVAEKVKQIFA